MYVIRNSQGSIIALSKEPGDSSEPANLDDPEVQTFLADGGSKDTAAAQMELLDVASVRIIEDLIDLLIDNGTILFTELPEQAQKRILERKRLRRLVRKEKGLDEADPSFILSEDNIFKL